MDLAKLFRLDGKKAVVIGGGGGIGTVLSKGLAIYGADVVIASRNIDKLKDVAKTIQSETSQSIIPMQVDATLEDSVRKLVDETLSIFGTVDVLVNSQGINIKADALSFSVQEWDKLFDINVKSVMLTCREFGKIMVQRRYGKIINLSSVRGVRATKWAGNLGYCTSKGAVDMLTKALAAEFGQYNINVNAIAPALVDTGFSPTLRDPEKIKLYTSNIPMGRIAVLEDIVGACIFLASAASDFINGQIIYIDGGLTVVG
ncbi:MAG: glucose 1-dehydrogenase [Candidatus Caldarchaeum sp.]